MKQKWEEKQTREKLNMATKEKPPERNWFSFEGSTIQYHEDQLKQKLIIRIFRLCGKTSFDRLPFQQTTEWKLKEIEVKER